MLSVVVYTDHVAHFRPNVDLVSLCTFVRVRAIKGML